MLLQELSCNCGIYRTVRRMLMLVMIGSMAHKTKSQNTNIPTAEWLLPGIGYRISTKTHFLAQHGWNNHLNTSITYLQAFFDIGKHITLNPAYLQLRVTYQNGTGSNEHTWMQAVIFKTNLHSIEFDNRSLFWYRPRSTGRDFFYYRNRLKASVKVGRASQPLRLYVFDEPWYLFTTGKWMRNRIAGGVNAHIAHWLQTDISFAIESDETNGRTNLFFFTATIELGKNQRVQSVK